MQHLSLLPRHTSRPFLLSPTFSVKSPIGETYRWVFESQCTDGEHYLKKKGIYTHKAILTQGGLLEAIEITK